MSSDPKTSSRRGVGFGIAFVVTGPSGAGKTSVINRVICELPRLAFSVSHTTRPRRRSEVDSKDYVFVAEKEFSRLASAGGFIEQTVYSGARYGTARAQLEKFFSEGNDVILNVEVEGAASLRAADLGVHPVVSIFLAPSTLDRLAERLRERGTEDESKIRERIRVASEELKDLPEFEYLVINDDLNDAVDELRSIIVAERLRVLRR